MHQWNSLYAQNIDLKSKTLKVVQYVPLLSVQEIILKYFIMIKYDYTNCNASQIMYLFINWSTSTRLPEKITTPHYKRTYYTSDHTPALFSKFDWNRMLYHFTNLSIFRERNDPSWKTWLLTTKWIIKDHYTFALFDVSDGLQKSRLLVFSN